MDLIKINGVLIDRDAIPKYLGKDRTLIPRHFIPHNALLDDKDCLEGEESGQHIMYMQEEKAFVLITDRPTEFIHNPLQKWTKK